ncbi:hypothetical protein [Streptomyces sp. MNU103]|uniref:hypothetical protein n=1 Tax=Streptomyces sp. MNU103 TaxID=2560024 RepID=UPI001E3F9D0C|nr:hypothetical protein [Streptomyces sp. MNU103]
MAVGGGFTSCNCGSDTCTSPTEPVATVGLCLADGTPIAVTVTRDCAGTVMAEGWIDLTAGTFTPGPAPEDAAPCDAGCVDTVCRQLCDDTDGDGQADVTYSELWCVRADGSAELVLTYQDDPSTPYVPTSPVDCVYGCPETETLTLCDDAGPFLRRVTFLNGTASTEDWELDGSTPHVASGEVRVCSATAECEAATTPAATLGLCLADGTPIAVVVTRDCAGEVTQDGWLNLTTGAWTAGDPPAGTMACGNPRSISTAGVFCDVDPMGGVLGLVLVEYTYGPEGSVESVRLVDATTGDTYTPQGEVTSCPAGVEQPERDVLQLCDTAEDGTVTEFVRDYVRDEAGAITGHADYLLDGTPYTPTGTVGRCVAECQDCQSVVLCDTVAGEPVAIAGTAAAGTLSNGVSYEVTGPSPFAPGRESDGAAWWGVAAFPNPSVPLTRWTFDQPVNVDFSVAMVHSPGTGPGDNRVQVQPGAVPLSLPAGYSFDHQTSVLTVDDTLTGCTLNTPTRDQSARFRVLGVTEVTLQYLGARALSAECRRLGTWEFGALDVSLGGQFLRTTCRDCTGAVTSTTDTLLDGATPYTPLGLVGVCQPDASNGGGEEEPCRDSSTLLVCDLPLAGDPTITSTNTDPLPYKVVDWPPANTPVADGSALWAGGQLTIGPDPDGGTLPVHRWTAATVQSGPAPCPDAVTTLTVRVHAHLDGPAAGFGGTGALQLFDQASPGAPLAQQTYPSNTPVGYDAVLEVSAPVDPVRLAAGEYVVVLNGETYHQGGKAWTYDGYEAEVTWDSAPCGTQFLRTVTVDCETGQVVATSDTTMDGAPYTVTGEVGQCQTAGGECCPPPLPETRVDVETSLLCVRDTASGDVLAQVISERLYDDQSGELLEQRVTTLDGAPYELPAGAELVRCPSPDRITRQVCVVETGTSEFLTNAANATSGQDTDWVWAPTIEGAWYPMYRVAPNAAWTVTDTAPNPARWVSPHQSRSVCSPNVATSPNVTGTWFTRASWNLPANVDPDTIRIAATVLNADNKVVQWRLNDGPWQPVAGGTLAPPAWTFPPTAVPGGRAGQNEVIVQVTETQPAVTCPSGNEAGMMLHVIASYDYEPRVWTQVIEPGGQVYYLDENGDRQDSIPDGHRLVACGGSGGEAPCCPPEPRVDVEAHLLCIRDQDGEITGQVIAEHVYDNQTGVRLEQRLTDPTTGDAVTLPAGAELVACEEPPCPVAFATECVGIVERTEASYDNTSMIGGVPGQCGGVQGPGGQFPCQPATGGLTIVSWTVNGEEVIGDGGRTFAGGPCGLGTAGNTGMHANWAAALTNLDPTGASWSAQNEPACLWFVGSTGGTQTTYGPMVVEDAGGQQWTLTPAQSCTETQFTKVYTQECDGTVSVSWLDADGVATDPPEGQQVPCGTGCGTGGGRNLDVETLLLCDVAEDGTSTPFVRHLSYNPAGQVGTVFDTGLDGFTPYTPSGDVGLCAPASEEEPCPSRNVLSACRWDDTDGDGIADQEYVELLAVDCDGVLSSVGTYTCDLAAPYTPVAPVDAPEDVGAEPAVGVQAHRVELPPGASWDAAAHGTLRSVTATAHTGTGQVTTGDGTSTLFRGESVTWGVDKEIDARLTGPLTIAAVDGIVTVAFTTGVNLS